MIEHVDDDRSPFRMRLFTTGGPLERTGGPRSGPLTLAVPVARVMTKNSLDMIDADRDEIVEATRAVLAAGARDAVLITHGTDMRADTVAVLDRPGAPVVRAGARACVSRGRRRPEPRPGADGHPPARAGIYAVPHGCVARGDRAVKNDERLTISPRAMSSANAQRG
ncbi:MAG: hypothetical protein CMP08_06205 [Xanthomonadales bacterium]|nr:hypothetical protein [Xanthomonadales bacterium]